MHYILFMILLVTQAGQPIPKSKRVYTLQTTQAIEFDTQDACKLAHDEIQRSIEITDTIALVSSCLPKGNVEAVAKPADKTITDKSFRDDTDKDRKPPKDGVLHFKTFD